MNKTRFMRAMFSGIVATLLSANAATALITFTHAGTGSGAVGSIAFSNADFVITAVGNADNRESFGFGSSIAHDTASIDISGVGIFTFVTGTQTFVNNDKALVGFSQTNGGDLFNGPGNAAFSTWALDTSIGPVTGSGELLQWDDAVQPQVFTDGGRIYFTDDPDTPVTVQASVVPVPAAIWLFASGLLGLIGIARRRNAF